MLNVDEGWGAFWEHVMQDDCPHPPEKVVYIGTGGFHFSPVCGVWDDIEPEWMCLSCGRIFLPDDYDPFENAPDFEVDEQGEYVEPGGTCVVVLETRERVGA